MASGGGVGPNAMVPPDPDFSVLDQEILTEIAERAPSGRCAGDDPLVHIAQSLPPLPPLSNGESPSFNIRMVCLYVHVLRE